MKKLFRPRLSKNATAKEIGVYFEEYTKARLLEMGFGYLAYSYKAHPYEIDLIMTEGSDIVFVEVKARSVNDPIKPELQADEKKMTFLFYAAAHFIAEMEDMGIYMDAFGYRFDVAAIEHEKDGRVADFRYHRNYYQTTEEELFRYARRYRTFSDKKK